MNPEKYSPPVDRLLSLGEPSSEDNWVEHLDYGFEPEHIPELIKMVTDDDLFGAPSENSEAWAPVHAWRALAELQAEAAIEPLLSILCRIDLHDDEWINEELPVVFSMIGPAAVPGLQKYLADPSREESAKIAAVVSLQETAKKYPEARDACAAALMAQLEQHPHNTEGLNGFLILALAEMRAAEALPLIEQSFAENHVDESVMGDWEDVQIEFGLKEKRETPKPSRSSGRSEPDFFHSASKTTKAKRKLKKKSRKKNRK